MKVFIICPVRKCSQSDKKIIEQYIETLESKGIAVHFPPRDTNQKDPIGKRICLDNKKAIKESDEVHIFWRKTKGSLFDLGMAFALGKKIVLINKFETTPEKSFENVLLDLNRRGYE